MSSSHHTRRAGLLAMSLAALGIVYGDIGTSPLYAFKEAFAGAHGLAPTHENVLATLSMLFWAVMGVISIKYVWIVLRFDNEGEGGVLALTALAHRLVSGRGWLAAAVVTVGIFAAALFYGDAIITPAISVLSAVEGIAVATPAMTDYVVPLTLLIIVVLFAVQRHGTQRVGRLFGPVTVIWFLTLATLGGISIAQTPAVLQALNPVHALNFAVQHPGAAFILLAAVFLALTGGEALYADMGHFGKRPIRLAWFVMVLPALLLNYFGQGALILRDPAAVENWRQPRPPRQPSHRRLTAIPQRCLRRSRRPAHWEAVRVDLRSRCSYLAGRGGTRRSHRFRRSRCLCWECLPPAGSLWAWD